MKKGEEILLGEAIWAEGVTDSSTVAISSFSQSPIGGRNHILLDAPVFWNCLKKVKIYTLA